MASGTFDTYNTHESERRSSTGDGPGERATATSDPDLEMSADRDFDCIGYVNPDDAPRYDDPDRLLPRSRHPHWPQHRR